jgi:hypothetical protein
MSKKSLLAVLAIFCGLGLLLSLSAPAYCQSKAKDTYILKGSPLGGVKFEHKLHADRAVNKCDTCHHASKPEKALAQPQQSCTDCHSKTVAAPMKTITLGAFHKTATAMAGTCIDCHKAENAKGKKAPVKCTECHKKENV